MISNLKVFELFLNQHSMTDESAEWNKDADKNLQNSDTFQHQEVHSDVEDIQNDLLNLISELKILKEKCLEENMTDEKSQKVLEFIEKTRQEIIKLKSQG